MDEFKNPFNTAYAQARELYGVELDSDEFENIAITAWQRIGNKQYALYRIAVEPVKVEKHVWAVDLPCNADEIVAVTSEYEDWEKTSNKEVPYSNARSWIEQYIEAGKSNTSPLYSSGRFIKYRREMNTLYFDDYYPKIFILYKGYIADEEGLPYLTDREVDAIAAFCAYIHDLKGARISRDKNSMELSLYMKQEWARLCNRARVPEYLNQNEMDEILNASVSWDRKRYGKSFKPIR